MPNVAVSTTSMMPIYRGYEDPDQLFPFRGDILLVRKVPISTLEVGDVIVFDTPSIADPVVHRIVFKWQDESGNFSFKTLGDNNAKIVGGSIDNWIVSGDAIHGKVVFRIPHIGWFLLTLQTNLGKIVVIALTILILFGEELLKYLGIMPAEEEQKTENSVDNTPTEATTHRKFKPGMITRLIRKKEFIYSGIAFLILLVFILSNILSSTAMAPSLNCYALADSSHDNNLLDSSPNSLIQLSTHEELIGPPNQTVYFYPIFIEISSGGFFNNIDYFTIKVNTTMGFYKWDIVYNFIGKRTIKGGIISNITGTVDIEINLFSRGIYSSTPITYNFPLVLQA